MVYQFASLQHTKCDLVEKWIRYNVLCHAKIYNIVLTYSFLIIYLYLLLFICFNCLKLFSHYLDNELLPN